jgi:hypothetical protein
MPQHNSRNGEQRNDGSLSPLREQGTMKAGSATTWSDRIERLTSINEKMETTVQQDESNANTLYYQWIASSVASLFIGTFFVFSVLYFFNLDFSYASFIPFIVAGLIQLAWLRCFSKKVNVVPQDMFRIRETKFVIAMTIWYLLMLLGPVLLFFDIAPKTEASLDLVLNYYCWALMLLWFAYIYLLLPADALTASKSREGLANCSLFLLVGHYGFCIVLPVYFCFREKTKMITKILVVSETIIFGVLLGILIADLDELLMRMVSGLPID